VRFDASEGAQGHKPGHTENPCRIARGLSLGLLRERHPGWIWTASRGGFGWEYHGRKLGSATSPVTFRAYSIADDFGDHGRTEWRNDTESYAFWAMREVPVPTVDTIQAEAKEVRDA